MEEGMQPATEAAGEEKAEAPAEGNRGLIERLRDRAYSFKAPDPLVEEAANEIVRLKKIIEDYAIICKHSEADIKRLKAAVAAASNVRCVHEEKNPHQSAQDQKQSQDGS